MKHVDDLKINKLNNQLLRDIENQEINIYTDGASRDNPGDAGAGV